MGALRDGVFAGVGALLGGAISRFGSPHYEDIETGGADRTAVFGDVMAMRTLIGAALGASVGGLVAGLLDPAATPPAPPALPPTST